MSATNEGLNRAYQGRGRRTGGINCLVALTLVAACENPPTNNASDMATTSQPDLTTISGELQPKVVALSATGHDRLYGVAYGAQGSFYATGILADGIAATDDVKMLLAKFTADGDLDKSFGTGGFVTKNVAVGTNGELARGIVVQSTGKIVISGTIEHAGAADARDRDIALVRFNSDGSLDNTFGTLGVVTLDLSAGEVVGTSYVADNTWGLSAYADDRLLVSAAQKRTGGTDTDFAVVRLTADGARDNTFGTQGVFALDINNRSASPRTTTLLPNGNIIVSGYMADGSVVKPVVFRLTSTGQLDPTFATAGIFNQAVLAATTEVYGAVQQGSSLVTVGYGRADAAESLDFLSLRLSENGALDTSYGTAGFTRVDVAGFNDNGRALVALPDSRVLMVGGGRPTETTVDGMVAILTTNGQKDTSFSPTGYKLYDFGGVSDFLWGASVSSDKSKVAMVGLKGVASPGNDDAVVLIMPLSK